MATRAAEDVEILGFSDVVTESAGVLPDLFPVSEEVMREGISRGRVVDRSGVDLRVSALRRDDSNIGHFTEDSVWVGEFS